MKHSKTLSFNIDLHLVIAILFAIIIGMIALWRPWESTKIERKITINGSATIQSTPDEFSFSPYYERTGTNTTALKNELNTFGTKLIDEVVKLGVKQDDITLNSNGYNRLEIAPVGPDGTSTDDSNSQTVTLSVSIKAPTKDIAQKVQDYLAKTDAKGSLTSQPIFSQTKRQNLEDEARDKAIKDARTKAERSAKNLGVTVGKVIEIKESQDGIAYPLYAKGAPEADTSISSLPVTPGKESVSSNVEVIFEIR